MVMVNLPLSTSNYVAIHLTDTAIKFALYMYVTTFWKTGYTCCV